MASLRKRIKRFFRKIWEDDTVDLDEEFEKRLQEAIADSRASASTAGHIAVSVVDHGYGNHGLIVNADHLSRLSADQGLMLIGEVLTHTTAAVPAARVAEYLNSYRTLGTRRFPDSPAPAHTPGPDAVLQGPSTTTARITPVDLLARFREAGQVPYETELMPIGDIVLRYGSPWESSSIRLRRTDIQWRRVTDAVTQIPINVPYYCGRVVPGWERDRNTADRTQAAEYDRMTDTPPVAVPAGRAVRKMFPNGNG